ncbi:hypothetical protein [Shimia sp.]
MSDTVKAAKTAPSFSFGMWVARIAAFFWSYTETQKKSDTSSFEGLL